MTTQAMYHAKIVNPNEDYSQRLDFLGPLRAVPVGWYWIAYEMVRDGASLKLSKKSRPKGKRDEQY